MASDRFWWGYAYDVREGTNPKMLLPRLQGQLRVHLGPVRFRYRARREPGCPHFKAGEMVREAVGVDIPKGP